MNKGIFIIPNPLNEQPLSYAPGSEERKKLREAITTALSQVNEIPMIIGGKPVRSDKKNKIILPHNIKQNIGYYFEGNHKHVENAIQSALLAKNEWEAMPWDERASIFLKAADMISGPYRSKINAATMLGQSKNAFQAEIDAACEMADFLRFNLKFSERIYSIQPNSIKGSWNRTDWRPLEGFVFALTPFNFTSIAGNLPTAPAMLGNTVVWKPSKSQIYSASVIMEILLKAGLPDGVINMVFASGPVTAETILNHHDFGGLHFTGSPGVFQSIWSTIAANLTKYKSYPRIVGETGGKDFVLVHSSANARQAATALVRGAFEYQGQKCSAASRAYIPDTLWKEISGYMETDLLSMKMGGVEDFGNFINAVIDEASFKRLSGVIDRIKSSHEAKVIMGGEYDMSVGYFIKPTVILTENPHYFAMEEEFFGPILTVYVYPEKQFDKILTLCDQTSPYALTGAIFARDRSIVNKTLSRLRYAAGNIYINDKPTGAVVSQQPFGGSRGSGTNDKAGSMLNLLRWLSPRSIKENFNPPIDFRYPFMLPD
jgi:1-pyrroline-5-carboxylate dehydrogenase